MIQPRDGARFALEPQAPIGLRRRVGRQDFDRHRPSDARVDRAIHLAHAPAAEEGDDLVRPQAGAGLQ